MNYLQYLQLDTANGFAHKDAEVRNATKELLMTIAQVCMRPDQIMDFLYKAELPDRLLREYQVSFDNMKDDRKINFNS